jgi:ubiquitin-protein ligase
LLTFVTSDLTAIPFVTSDLTAIPNMIYVLFQGNFPFEPPFVRVIKPFIHCACVVSGGAFCMELLSHSGWSCAYCLESLIIQIAATLVEGEAYVERDSATVLIIY